MRLIFMGSPEFAVPSLDALARSSHEVIEVVTQPDRPSGRGLKLRPSAVAVEAERHGIVVSKPEKFRAAEFVDHLRSLASDLVVVVAFGEILRKKHLDLGRLGCVNLHPSLLPRHRGPTPIQYTLLAGDEVTGVTTIYMDRGVDTGDIILQREAELRPEDNAGTLHDRLAVVGAELLVQTCDRIESGDAPRIEQDDTHATHGAKLSKRDGLLDWARDATQLERHVRAMTPWPGARTRCAGELIHVVRALASDEGPRTGRPGEIVECDSSSGILVACGSGWLRLVEVKPAGSRAMSAIEFLCGHSAKEGDVLGGADT